MLIATERVSISVPTGIPMLLRDLIHEHTGIFFEPHQFDIMLDKLRSRLIALGCHSYLDYYYILKYDAQASNEWLRASDAFSVQETYFWRESSQISMLTDVIVPDWFRRHSIPLHIWSAACATGEEPASIAIALREAGWGGHPIVISASDASESALEKARAGIYRERSFRSLPTGLREKYFEPVAEGSRLRSELLLPIAFKRANLVDRSEIARLAMAEVVFCRNVFIYFSTDAIRRTVAHFSELMPDGGKLYVAAAESLLGLTDHFDLKDVSNAFVYMRKPRS